MSSYNGLKVMEIGYASAKTSILAFQTMGKKWSNRPVVWDRNGKVGIVSLAPVKGK